MYAVGFDIGGTNIRAIMVGADGSIGPTRSERRPDDVADIVTAVVDLAAEVERESGVEPVALGFGCAGIVDRDGVVRRSPNVPTMLQFPLGDMVAERVHHHVRVENDATCGAAAEAKLGAGRGADHMLFVALGTGIGVGLVLDGNVYRGASGFAGESGHIIVVRDGIDCPCGRSGCWERYASGTALNRLAVEAAVAGRAPGLVAGAGGEPTHVTSAAVAAAADASDPEALAILADLGVWVGVGLNNLVNTLDPEVVIIGGGLSDIGEPIRAAVEAGYKHVMIDHADRGPVAIRLSEFGGRAGAVGAAWLALDEHGEGRASP